MATPLSYVRELGLSWWGLFLIAVVVFLAINEVGYRLGGRHHQRAPEGIPGRKEQAGTMVAALLALLGLLLAFSFSIVENRFARRRALVLDEANAIGTAYLRARALPAPHDDRLGELLRDYVEVRVVRRDPDSLARALARAEELHAAMWTEAVAVAGRYPESEVVGVFLIALNEVIDLHQSRVTVGLHQSLPRPILTTITLVALLAMGVLGYSSGLSRARSFVPTTAVIVAIAFVVVLIIELDRPGGRLFEISQAAMDDTRETVERDYDLRREAGASPAATTPGP